jgi:ATP-binding cassette subfamily C protein
MRKLFKIFGDIAREYPFHCLRFIAGNVIMGTAQVVSIGCLFPILHRITAQKGEDNLFIKYFDRVLGFFGFETNLLNYLLLFITVALISAIVFLLAEMAQAQFLKLLEEKNRRSLIETVINARWSELKGLNHGEFVNAATRETESYKFVIKYTFLIISTFIQVLFLSYFIFRINLKFAAVSFALMFIGTLVFLPLTKFSSMLGRMSANIFGKLTSSLVNASRAFKNIKADSLENFFLKHINPVIQKASSIYYKKQVLASLHLRALELVGYCILSFLVYLGLVVMKVNVAKLAVSLIVLSRIVPKVREISHSFNQVYGYLPSVMKIQKIKDQCVPAAGETRTKTIEGRIKAITLEGTGFSYDRGNRLFDSLNARIQRGAFWAICGETGSGKTTILDLISGILSPTSGYIRYDGIDSREVKLGSLHQRIGYLSQNSFIFAGSILENICWGNENPDLSKLDQVIGLSQLKNLINEKTLDFPVSESGHNLSVGQQQRIAIARVLLKNYDFILMDEPTSAVDMQTEERFLKALSLLKGKVGIIMVTHRREYLKHADRILQLNNRNIEIPAKERL